MSEESSPHLAKAFSVIFDGIYVRNAQERGKILSKLKACYIKADHELSELLENPPSAPVWGLDGILSEVERLVKFQFTRVSTTAREFATKSNMKKLDALVQYWEQQGTILKWIKVMVRRVSARATNSGRTETNFESSLMNILNHAFHDSFYDFFKRDLGDEVTAVINRIRDGEVTDSSDIAASVKQALDFYETMGLGTENEPQFQAYEEDFEPYFLTGTKEYYVTLAAEWDRRQDSADFLRKVEDTYEKEKEIVSTYLRDQTREKVHAMLDEILVEKYKESFLEREGSGCKALLKSDLSSENPSVADLDKRDQLKRMKRVLQKLPENEGLALMAERLHSVIIEEGQKLYLDRKERIARKTEAKKEEKKMMSAKEKYFDETLVKALHALHSKFTYVTASILDGLRIFEAETKKALTSVMNMTVDDEDGLTAIICAYVCDQGLDKTGAKSSEVTADTIMKDLFDYLNDKDMFEDSYRDLLGKRLLRGRSVLDEERDIVSKLTLKCGKNFTLSMGTMLNDLNSSSEQLKEFKKQNTDTALIFDIKVLTKASWGKFPEVRLKLPDVLASQQKAFDDFYRKESNDSKKLDFAYTMGDVDMHMTVEGKKGPKKYFLTMSTLQAAVLDVFNQVTEITYSELEQRLALRVTGVEDALKMILHPLVFKVKILKKDPESKSIRPGDKIVVNPRFSSKKTKINIPMPSLDGKKSRKSVEDNRGHVLDAAIVRIMKTRNIMDHSELVAEVFKQVHIFEPKTKAIKKQIESLINREYLERGEGSTKTYKYLA